MARGTRLIRSGRHTRWSTLHRSGDNGRCPEPNGLELRHGSTARHGRRQRLRSPFVGTRILLRRAPTGLAVTGRHCRGRTDNGGWTRTQLAAWGVPWPPPKGWKSAWWPITAVELLARSCARRRAVSAHLVDRRGAELVNDRAPGPPVRVVPAPFWSLPLVQGLPGRAGLSLPGRPCPGNVESPAEERPRPAGAVADWRVSGQACPACRVRGQGPGRRRLLGSCGACVAGAVPGAVRGLMWYGRAGSGYGRALRGRVRASPDGDVAYDLAVRADRVRDWRARRTDPRLISRRRIRQSWLSHGCRKGAHDQRMPR